MLIAQADGLVV